MAQKLYVGLDKKYHSINEALKVADDGDTVLISSGIYKEDCIVNRKITIVGEDGVVVEPSEQMCLILVATCTIKNVSFQKHTDFSYAEFKKKIDDNDFSNSVEDSKKKIEYTNDCCVQVTKTKAAFENCRFCKNDYDGLYLQNANVEMKKCEFSDFGKCAIFADGNSFLKMTNCTVHDNMRSFVIDDTAVVFLLHCDISKTLDTSITMNKDTKFGAENSLFDENKNTFVLNEKAHLDLTSCKIKNANQCISLNYESCAILDKCSFAGDGNEMNGILVEEGSRIFVDGCNFKNLYQGIEAYTTQEQMINNCSFNNVNYPFDSDDIPSHCKILNCKFSHADFGIKIDRVSHVFIESCFIEKCGVGIFLCEKGKCELKNNTIKNCNDYALWISGDINISDCTVSDNGKYGVCISNQSLIKLNSCKLFNNGFIGIAASDNSKVSLCDCDIYDNKVKDVGSKDGATVKTKNCKVKDEKQKPCKKYIAWTVVVKPLAKENFPEYSKVLATSFGSAFDIDDSDDDYNNFFDEKNTTVFMAWLGGKAVGTIQVTIIKSPRGCSFGYVVNFCVVPEFRRFGVGTLLMEKVKDHCMQNEAFTVSLSSANIPERKAAKCFYKKAGFDGDKEQYFECDLI